MKREIKILSNEDSYPKIKINLNTKNERYKGKSVSNINYGYLPFVKDETVKDRDLFTGEYKKFENAVSICILFSNIFANLISCVKTRFLAKDGVRYHNS